jgi:malate dehydrogenase (oxaloacetate-decarboxylating)(NADP+)
VQALADIVSPQNLAQGRLYPPLEDIREVSLLIAKAIVDDAYANGECCSSKLKIS